MRGGRGSGVHVGRDGWLFWLGRSGEMRRLYRRSLRVRWAVWRWRRLIERRHARAQALGCRYVQVVVPDKLSIYDDALAAPILDAEASIGRTLRAALAGSAAVAAWIDLFRPLSDAKSGGDVFFRTDTHWSYHGCHAAYRAICEACAIAPAPHVGAPRRLAPIAFALDLGRKLDPPVTECIAPPAFELRARRTDENPLARYRREHGMNRPGFHVGTRIVLTNTAPDAAPLRIVLFGDSFSSEEGYTLTVMLAESVRELHYIWSANIDWAYVEAVRPALVIHEIAERFLRRIPSDRFRVDDFAAERLRKAGIAPASPSVGRGSASGCERPPDATD